MIEITALWKNTSKDGKTYLAGPLGRNRLLVFPNNYKEKETDPDYIIYIKKHERKEGIPVDSFADDIPQ